MTGLVGLGWDLVGWQGLGRADMIEIMVLRRCLW
jgi:hypothetical protein